MTGPARTAAFCSSVLPGMPALASRGERKLTSVQTVDSDSDGTLHYRRQLWELLPSGPKPLMSPDAFDTAPVFAPMSERFAFLSDRAGRRLAYASEGDASVVLDLTAGTELRGTPSALAWLDRDHLVIVVDQPVDETTPEAPVEIGWLRYKQDGRSGFVDSGSSLWLAKWGDPEATRLLYTADGSIGSIATGHDELVFTVNPIHCDADAIVTEVHRARIRREKEELAWGGDTIAWKASGAVTAVTLTDLSREIIAISNSPVGQSAVPLSMWSIAAAGSEEGQAPVKCFAQADYECERAVQGDMRHLGTPSIVRPIPCSDDVIFIATTGFDVALFAGNPKGPRARRITPQGVSVVDFSEVQDGQVLVCLESPTMPSECYALPVDSGEAPEAPAVDLPESLSRFNSEWTAAVPPTPPEYVEVTAPDGLVISAMLYRAPDNPDNAMIIKVHGGPHLSVGNSFDSETQLQLEARYHVLLPNIRGSAGRGREFRALSIGEWGRKDYEDVMALTDWAVASGNAAADQLYLTGGSYGGFIVNWTLTQSSRYRAAVAERSISNFISKIGTADNGATTTFELGGHDLFGDGGSERLWHLSPLRHVTKVTTPLLLLHGESDYRCPIEQSEQFFAALKRLDQDVQFVRYPGESHALPVAGTPANRIDRLSRIISWFDAHRNNGSATTKPTETRRPEPRPSY